MNKKIHNSECIACGAKKYTNYHDVLIECSKCGLISAKEIPTFDELKQLYEKEYFFGMEYSDYIADRKALEKNFKKRINYLDRFINKNTFLVEVGCAYGYFLNMVKDKVEIHKGYDVSKEGVDYAVNELGLNATTKDFIKDKSIKNNEVDIVCMWDVMEHFGEPDKHVKRAADVLKRGGALSLTTGDISAFTAKKRGAKWRMIHPPTHLYYFTPSSITALLERHGFSVVSIRHKATYRNVGSVFNQLICNKKVKNKNTALLDIGHNISKAIMLDKLNIPLNLYDVMEVTAIKK